MDNNFSVCKNPDCSLLDKPQGNPDFNEMSDKICPECKQLLELPYQKPAIPIKKVLIFSSIVIVIGLSGWGIISLFTNIKSKEIGPTTKDIPSITNKEKTDNVPVNTVNVSKAESDPTVNNNPKIAQPEKSPKQNVTSNLIPENTLEEYFQKIADESIEYGKKSTMKKEIIFKFFSGETALVIQMGKNNTEVGHTPINDYVEELSHQFTKTKIIKKEFNSSQKIIKLYIQE